MPTYTNGTGAPFAYENLNGDTVFASAGGSFQTYKFYSDSGLTETSETPLKTFSTNYTVTNDTGGAKFIKQAIGNGVKRFRVLVNTAGITVKVYRQNTSGDPMPPTGGLTSAYGIWSFELDEQADTLLFHFSGDGNLTLEVIE